MNIPVREDAHSHQRRGFVEGCEEATGRGGASECIQVGRPDSEGVTISAGQTPVLVQNPTRKGQVSVAESRMRSGPLLAGLQ